MAAGLDEVYPRARAPRQIRIEDATWIDPRSRLAEGPTIRLMAEFQLDGQTDPVDLVYSKVIPGFLEALGIGVVQGRSFTDADTASAPDVALVNESLARRFFPGQYLVGRHIRWPGDDAGGDRVFEIIGVVRDTKTRYFIAEPEPTVYFSYPQHPYPTGSARRRSARGQANVALRLPCPRQRPLQLRRARSL